MMGACVCAVPVIPSLSPRPEALLYPSGTRQGHRSSGQARREPATRWGHSLGTRRPPTYRSLWPALKVSAAVVCATPAATVGGVTPAANQQTQPPRLRGGTGSTPSTMPPLRHLSSLALFPPRQLPGGPGGPDGGPLPAQPLAAARWCPHPRAPIHPPHPNRPAVVLPFRRPRRCHWVLPLRVAPVAGHRTRADVSCVGLSGCGGGNRRPTRVDRRRPCGRQANGRTDMPWVGVADDEIPS